MVKVLSSEKTSAAIRIRLKFKLISKCSIYNIKNSKIIGADDINKVYPKEMEKRFVRLELSDDSVW